jgi:membrane fusion protein, heavy metal efflux system
MKKIATVFFALTAILAGCHSPQDDHGHDHDDINVLITVYEEGLEIFAEATPFARNSTSEIIAHFTWVENFKPLDGARITMNLITGSSGIRQTVDTPRKPGIYVFNLTPLNTGKAQIRFDIEYEGRMIRIHAGTVEVFEDDHTAIHAAEEMMIENAAAITFTKEQSWQIAFATAPAVRQPQGTVIKTVGEILPAPGDEFTLSAGMNGFVQFVHASPFEGTQIQRGEILMQITGSGLAEGNATQRYQQAQSNFERSRINYERISLLAQERIVSETELVQARNEFENARAAFENISRNFTTGGQTLRSPESGFISSMLVQHGQYVEAGQPLASVSRNQNFIVRAEVPQRFAGLLHELHDATLVFNEKLAFSLSDLDGRILSAGNSIGRQSHLIPIHLQVKRTPLLFAGSLIDVYLKTRPVQEQIAVPVSAVIEEQGNFFVFVQIHPESFEKRQVITGQTDGLYMQIQQGLQENERIVTRGATIVKMAAAASAVDPHSGHVH